MYIPPKPDAQAKSRAKDLFGQLKDLVVDRSKDFVVFMAPGVAGYGAWLSELVSAFDDLPSRLNQS